MIIANLPSELEAFVDHVVPILQARGIFRTEYEGTTLRDNLGLPYAENILATKSKGDSISVKV